MKRFINILQDFSVGLIIIGILMILGVGIDYLAHHAGIVMSVIALFVLVIFPIWIIGYLAMGFIRN